MGTYSCKSLILLLDWVNGSLTPKLSEGCIVKLEPEGTEFILTLDFLLPSPLGV